MGVYAAGYPNFFMITGPQAPFANLPTSIEQNVAYITGLYPEDGVRGL